MIKSVGMAPKGFRRMVALESLFYGLKALVIGLPLSVLVHMAMWAALRSSFQLNLPQTFNLWAYLGAMAGVFLITGAALLYAIGKVKKDNIIETLKSEDN